MNSIVYLLLSKSISTLPMQVMVVIMFIALIIALVYFTIKLTVKVKKYLSNIVTKEEHEKIEEENVEIINEKIELKIKESNVDNCKEFLEKIEKLNEELTKFVLRDEFDEKIDDIHEETNFLADKIDSLETKLNDTEIRLCDKIVESERRQTDNITNNIREMFRTWAAFTSSNKPRD